MNNEMIEIENIARKWHAGQKRHFCDADYIEHPKAVFELLVRWGVADKDVLSIAWAHDLREETSVPQGEPLEAVGQKALAAIEILTRRECESKRTYIQRVAESNDCNTVLVKVADRLCNTSDFLRAEKWEKAEEYFGEAAPVFAWLKTHVSTGKCDEPGRKVLVGINGFREVFVAGVKVVPKKPHPLSENFD